MLGLLFKNKQNEIPFMDIPFKTVRNKLPEVSDSQSNIERFMNRLPQLSQRERFIQRGFLGLSTRIVKEGITTANRAELQECIETLQMLFVNTFEREIPDPLLNVAIPKSVYYCAENNNFYNTDTKRGMGSIFHKRWFALRDHFPKPKPSTRKYETFNPETDS